MPGFRRQKMTKDDPKNDPHLYLHIVKMCFRSCYAFIYFIFSVYVLQKKDIVDVFFTILDMIIYVLHVFRYFNILFTIILDIVNIYVTCLLYMFNICFTSF